MDSTGNTILITGGGTGIGRGLAEAFQRAGNQVIITGSATIMTVTSGLAFVPVATNPTYCATKAAIHSWTQSLRYQLRDTSVEVLEIVPPYVQTELTGAHQLSDPNAMPLGEYIEETMELLRTPPSGEILVKRVYPQRFAEREGKYDELYAQRNEQAMQRAARLKAAQKA